HPPILSHTLKFFFYRNLLKQRSLAAMLAFDGLSKLIFLGRSHTRRPQREGARFASAASIGAMIKSASVGAKHALDHSPHIACHNTMLLNSNRSALNLTH